MKLTLASLFDGSGTAPLAASICGITPVWASEIEPYPIRVTTKRFPNMKHYGSITDIDGAKVDPVDIICGGSPCQDLSVAGKQAGLDGGTRSHLFYEMVRIIKEMRKATDGKKPRYIVWENVPGAFSSNNGYDFMSVLQSFAEIAEADVHVPEPERKANKLVWRYAGEMVGFGWSIAWRTVDAQYWGVPQRRRRIYLVVDLDSERAGEILFECESLSGDPEPCEEAREGAASNAAGGAGGSDRACLSFHLQQDPISSETIAPCLSGQDQASVGVASFMGGQGPKAGGLGYAEEVAPTLKAAPSGGNTVPDVVYAINDKATRNRGGGPTRHDDGAGNGFGVQDDGAMYTLDTASRHAVCYPETARCLAARHDGSPCVDRGPDVVCHAAGFNDATGERAQGSMEYCEERSPTLRAGDVKSVVYDARGNGDGSTVPTLTGDHENRVTDYTAICVGNGQMCNITMAEVSNTLDCMHDQQAILTDGKPPRKYIVRRLTPLECCRLQGFPDCWELDLETPSPTEEDIAFWTEIFETHRKVVSPDVKPKTRNQIIKWLKNPYSDSASYKMWGNGMALPNMLFVVSRIKEMHHHA